MATLVNERGFYGNYPNPTGPTSTRRPISSAWLQAPTISGSIPIQSTHFLHYTLDPGQVTAVAYGMPRLDLSSNCYAIGYKTDKLYRLGGSSVVVNPGGSGSGGSSENTLTAVGRPRCGYQRPRRVRYLARHEGCICGSKQRRSEQAVSDQPRHRRGHTARIHPRRAWNPSQAWSSRAHPYL